MDFLYEIFKGKSIFSFFVLTFPSYVTANNKTEEPHFKVLNGIDKAGEMTSLGIDPRQYRGQPIPLNS